MTAEHPSDVGAQAAAALAAAARWPVAPGLTDAELASIEARFDIAFSVDHRAFLASGVPTGPNWPDWRGDEMGLRMHLGLPARELIRGSPAMSRPVAQAPRLIPLYGYCFMPPGPGRPGAPLITVDGSEVSCAATDLVDFVRRLRDDDRQPVPQRAPGLPFWDELIIGPEPEPPLPDLPVPPFRPDPSTPMTKVVPPPRDPQAALAALGVQLPDLTRHDGLLSHGGPLWAASVPAGAPAASAWESVRSVFDQTGLWPVLFTDRTWQRIGTPFDDDRPLLSAELDGAAWLSREYAERTQDEPLPRGGYPNPPADDDTTWSTMWPDVDDDHEFTHLALISTTADWYVPGLLQWSGAVNGDVQGLEHASVLRRWSGLWGTELLGLADETMVLRTTRPPTDPADALATGVEMYLYCRDIVDTNPDGVDILAPQATWGLWLFWWD